MYMYIYEHICRCCSLRDPLLKARKIAEPGKKLRVSFNPVNPKQ